MARTFRVATTTRSRNKEVVDVSVTDAKTEDELQVRPKAAVFPISELYDEEQQTRRAKDYCAYLNKLAEAAEEAYEQNKLINILKS